MHELITKFLGGQGAGLSKQLMDKLGLDADGAKGFIGAACEKVLDSVKGGKVDASAVLGGNVSEIVSKIDVAGLAQKTGLDQAKVTDGLKTVVPGFLDSVKEQAGGASGLLSMLGGGGNDLLGKAKGFFGG